MPINPSFSFIIPACHRRMAKCFRRLDNFRIRESEREEAELQSKLLHFAKHQPSGKELELQGELEAEREKAVIFQARHNQVVRALESAEMKLQELSLGSGLNSEREMQLESKLKAEQEKVVVANARYNTLKNRSEKEIAQLKSLLHEAQQYLGSQKERSAITTFITSSHPVIICHLFSFDLICFLYFLFVCQQHT